mmetsp:Transcript_12939/g.34530  ORF Transcript_12939/g.34530 Transcript_12939/m.34530 type:complete len:209 (+) Transcript_12939:2741-3367(+)
MTQQSNAAHGSLGDPTWPVARCVVQSKELARPGYKSETAAEYLDSPEVIDAKVAVLAHMLRKSPATVAYTGAGLSTAAGIGDYASRASGTLALRWGDEKGKQAGTKAKVSMRARQPTQAHRVLAGLERVGLLHQWINQNHDGLAQKATFPQERLVEIHGRSAVALQAQHHSEQPELTRAHVGRCPHALPAARSLTITPHARPNTLLRH